jgi:hypothetical protein
MKVGDKVILLNNVIEERKKLGYSNNNEYNTILSNAIGKLYIIERIGITKVYCNLEHLYNIVIPLNSIKNYRKEKLKHIIYDNR